MARRHQLITKATKKFSAQYGESAPFIVLHNSSRIRASNRLVRGNPKDGDMGLRFTTVEKAIEAIKAGMTYTFQGHKQETIEFKIMDMDSLEIVKSFALSFNPILTEN